MPKKAAVKKAAPKPRQRQPGSVADHINNLESGQSYSVSSRISLATKDCTGPLLLETLKGMRNNLASYVVRITDELDAREFKVESGSFLTDDKSAVVMTAVVTRVD